MHYVSIWISGTFVASCGNTLGMNELSSLISNNALSIYPSPTSNQIIIEFELPEQENLSFEIRNVLGESIKITSNYSLTKGNNKIKIDVSEFSNGLYFLQLQTDNKIISKKFIKQ